MVGNLISKVIAFSWLFAIGGNYLKGELERNCWHVEDVSCPLGHFEWVGVGPLHHVVLSHPKGLVVHCQWLLAPPIWISSLTYLQMQNWPPTKWSTVQALFSDHRFSGKPLFKGHSLENLGDHFWLFVHKSARKENLNLTDKSLVADFSAKSIFHCIMFTYDEYKLKIWLPPLLP